MKRYLYQMDFQKQEKALYRIIYDKPQNFYEEVQKYSSV